MEHRQSINNQTDLALTIANRILLEEARDKNMVFSPLSIHAVLSLIAAGSKGSTLEQLLSFLKSDSTDHLNSFVSKIVAAVFADGSPNGGPRLSFADGVWVDQSLLLKPSFKQIVETTYKAALAQVNFQTKAEEVAKEVNSWAEEETCGLIKEILPHGSVKSSTRLLIANALYFKGAWMQKFESSRTKDYDFHLLNGSSVKVPFMTTKRKQFVGAFDGFKVLGLPYKQGEDKRHFCMYFFLPDAKDRLLALSEKLGSESAFLERHLPYQRCHGDFRIPRFKISFAFEASHVLKELGLVLPFSVGELTEMVDSPAGQNLHVSRIWHKSFVEVNEEGVEAAAVSVGDLLCCLEEPTRINFVANHPFLFVIREDMTGTVLFIGQVQNPLAE